MSRRVVRLPMSLPEIVESDIGALCAELVTRGFKVDVLSVGSMHSYQVSVSGPLEFTITADRSQLFLEGERETLEPVGLWRAFDDPVEFSDQVLRFVESRRAGG
jgi:hypothetical protein